MTWETICPYHELPDGAGLAALVEGRQIAVFRVRDQLYAIENFDPIGRANVLSRGIVCSLQDQPCVASPLYKQHFSLVTGECLEDSDVKINCYEVRNHEGNVEINKAALELCAA